jgi:beta-galactosidase
VLFLYIAAIDKNGTIVPGFSNEIHLTINGQATVMNIGDIKAEAGIATALIKMGDEQGTLKFSAKADRLTGGVLEL